jgi:hypothetical protein
MALLAPRVVRRLDATKPTNAPETPRWIFPGHLRVHPISPTHMSNLPARWDIDTNEGRHAALVDLAADLPPPVLASMLGVHITTALRWAARAQRDWSTYLAERAHEQLVATTAGCPTQDRPAGTTSP